MIVHFFIIISNAKDNTNFTIEIQIDMSPITKKKKKKKIKHLLTRLLKFIDQKKGRREIG